MGKSLIIHRR